VPESGKDTVLRVRRPRSEGTAAVRAVPGALMPDTFLQRDTSLARRSVRAKAAELQQSGCPCPTPHHKPPTAMNSDPRIRSHAVRFLVAPLVTAILVLACSAAAWSQTPEVTFKVRSHWPADYPPTERWGRSGWQAI